MNLTCQTPDPSRAKPYHEVYSLGRLKSSTAYEIRIRLGVPTIMENQMEKEMENEMETGVI